MRIINPFTPMFIIRLIMITMKQLMKAIAQLV